MGATTRVSLLSNRLFPDDASVVRITRVAVVVSHPIQHFCPQYTSWAALPGVHLKVFFASKHGLEPYADKNFGRAVKWAGIVLDFPHQFCANAQRKALGTTIDSPDLPAHLVDFAPDVVVVYGYAQRLQRRALRWARNNNVPVLMISDSELRGHRGIAKRAIKALIVPRLLKDVKLFLTVGDANEAYYRNYGIQDVRFIRCFFPIDVRLYDSVLATREQCRSRVRERLEIPPSHSVVLMVGKLVSWKRQMDLVLASNAFRKGKDDVTIVLVGSGPDEATLRKHTRRIGSGGVVFAGFISPELLPEYYCAADIYVQCSSHEPHSLAISEAVYCGLPVVLSDLCGSYGPTDDVQLGLNGLVYRCGDIEQLSRTLEYVLGDHEFLAGMREASTRIGRQNQQLAHGQALTQALAVLQSDNSRSTRSGKWN